MVNPERCGFEPGARTYKEMLCAIFGHTHFKQADLLFKFLQLIRMLVTRSRCHKHILHLHRYATLK